MKFSIILISLILTLHISDSVFRAETGQDIHMTVSVIPRNRAMLKPDYALQSECLFQFPFDFILSEIFVPVQ